MPAGRILPPWPPTTGENDGDTCQSCGDTATEVLLVRRLYVTPPAWDQEGQVRIGADEQWCFVCRTHYPHQELDAAGEPVEHELGWSTEVEAG